jgi:hypothetical protein
MLRLPAMFFLLYGPSFERNGLTAETLAAQL